MIFVHWKKGSERWLKYSFKVFYILLLLNYVILPVLNLLIFIYYILDPRVNLKANPVESYIIFTAIVCLSRLLEFFTLIRRSILLDAKIFREM